MQLCIQVKRRTIPDSHHSSECVRVSGLTEDPPRARIMFSRGNDRNGWDGLDDDLKRYLKKILKRDDSMKLEWLKGEKKALRRRWKSSKEEEKVGLSVLWEELKESVKNYSHAEGIRQKNYERRKARRRFFIDPYRYGKALLDPPKSGELKVGAYQNSEGPKHRSP